MGMTGFLMRFKLARVSAQRPDGEDILKAIEDTANGRVHLDSRIAGKVLHEFRRLQTEPKTENDTCCRI